MPSPFIAPVNTELDPKTINTIIISIINGNISNYSSLDIVIICINSDLNTNIANERIKLKAKHIIKASITNLYAYL